MRLSKRDTGLVLLCIFVASLTSIATMPAAWLMHLIPENGLARMTSASGSIWSGRAVVNVGQRGFEVTLPDTLSWEIQLNPLPRLVLSHAWLSGPITITPTWSGMEISGQTVTLPASLLGSLDARVAAFGPSGQIAASWPSISIGPASPRAGSEILTISWQHISSALAHVKPLGSYRTTISFNEKGGADLLLGTAQGPLLIEGSGQLDKSHNLSLNATLRIEPGAAESTRSGLNALLATIGPSRNGITALRYP